jgi:hypothetical protein
MPLIKSGSKQATKDNFKELRQGKTFAKTSKKFGKKKAEAQMDAIALKNQAKYSSKRGSKKR